MRPVVLMLVTLPCLAVGFAAAAPPRAIQDAGATSESGVHEDQFDDGREKRHDPIANRRDHDDDDVKSNGLLKRCGIDRSVAGRFPNLQLSVFGRSRPPGAQVIPICDYLHSILAGTAKPISPPIVRRQTRVEHLEDVENRHFVIDYLTQHHESTLLQQFLDLDPAPAADIEPSGDGNWSVTLPDGRRIMTLGHRFQWRNMAEAIKLATNSPRQLDMYRTLYDALPAAVRDPAASGLPALPTPSTLGNASLAQVQSALHALAGLAPQLEALQSVGRAVPLQCGSETGSSTLWGDDRYDDQDGAKARYFQVHDGFGLYANFNFSRKPYLNCVRDQANRGSCVAFAVTSATETAIARATGEHVNLSEQDVYEHYKLGLWGQSPEWYGDGAWAKVMVPDMIASGYAIPYEKSWDYNPSQSRQTLPNGFYEFSCNGYPNSKPCSDTAPQAPLVCGLDPQSGNWYCSLEDAGVPGSTHAVTAGGDFWMDGSLFFKILATDLIRVHLALNHEVTIGFTTTPKFFGLAFRKPDQNGTYVPPANGYYTDNPYGSYLTIDSADLLTGKGGHEIHVVGFVSNDDLKLAIPGAPPAPAVGYFIIRNSWGPAWGDAGYGYLPYDYVLSQADEAVYISGIQ